MQEADLAKGRLFFFKSSIYITVECKEREPDETQRNVILFIIVHVLSHECGGVFPIVPAFGCRSAQGDRRFGSAKGESVFREIAARYCRTRQAQPGRFMAGQSKNDPDNAEARRRNDGTARKHNPVQDFQSEECRWPFHLEGNVGLITSLRRPAST